MKTGITKTLEAVDAAQASTITNIEYDFTDGAAVTALAQVSSGLREALTRAGTTFCARRGYEQPFWIADGKCYVFEDRLQEAAF